MASPADGAHRPGPVSTLGVVLAGGQGRRLGLGRPKAFATLAGRPLLERAVAILKPVCEAVVVVAPAGLALPPCSARRVDDPEGVAGPLAGLVAGLASTPHERAVALGVDFPLMRKAALRGMMRMLSDRQAVVPAPGGRLQPLAAVYAASSVTLLSACLDGGMRAVTEAVGTLQLVVVDDRMILRLDGGEENFLNVNTPDDLDRAQRVMGLRARGMDP
jgi:molybdenum cofactor guanylyltransferase